MALTRRQREVLDVIEGFIARNGYSPSLEEIGASLGLSSVATVHKHVTHLVEKGFVRRSWNQNRSIETVDQGTGGESLEIPLMGFIAAGKPVEAVTSEEPVRIPAGLVRGRESTYILKVQGESMIDEQIRDGDMVIVEGRQVARDGETVVALIDRSEVTLKRFFHEGATVRLQPANDLMAPITIPADRIQVQGVVVGLMRKY